MKIKLRVSYASAAISGGPNDEIEVDDADAVRLIAKGYAAPLGAAPKQTAALPPAEEKRPLSVPAFAIEAAQAETRVLNKKKGKRK